MVILAGQDCPIDGLERAALVADHLPARLERLGRAGVRVVAMESPPFNAATFRRLQVFTGVLPPEQVDFGPMIAPSLGRALPRLCLTLPEFPQRTRQFAALGRQDFRMVQGLRCQPSWTGAAHSYSRLAQALLDAGRERALIAQDDMLPGADFDRRLDIAEDYWVQSGADMFAGLVTDHDESFVLRRVVRHRGMTFLHLNKSVGLVCNMFGRRALIHMTRWDAAARAANGEPLTIDRHMAAAPDFDVVTTLPFLVHHRSGARSTIWSFGNGRYDTLIKHSERRLAQMARRQASDRR